MKGMLVYAIGLGALVSSAVFADAEGKGTEKTIKAKVIQQSETKAEPKSKKDEPTGKATPVAKPQSSAEAPKVAVADDSALVTVCHSGQLQRHVEVRFNNPTTKAPCKVHYRKETESPGHHQVLWSAAHNGAFCESKARAFVKKLEGWGWNCKGDLEPAG